MSTSIGREDDQCHWSATLGRGAWKVSIRLHISAVCCLAKKKCSTPIAELFPPFPVVPTNPALTPPTSGIVVKPEGFYTSPTLLPLKGKSQSASIEINYYLTI